MAYQGLAAFEAEAELNASMKVNPSRRAAWTSAVKAADQAVRLDRPNRIHLLTYVYDPVPQKIASGPKKQKRSYVRKSAKTSSVGGDKNFVDNSAVSHDDASPPRKKFRRRSSLPLKEQNDVLSGSRVLSAATECNEPSSVFASESATGKNVNGKNSLYF